jgi:ribose 5-phosphate isomerase RpiB
MKVLVHDGIGVWLAARRLNQRQVRLAARCRHHASLSRAQFDALVLGLPWQRIGEAGVITVVTL